MKKYSIEMLKGEIFEFTIQDIDCVILDYEEKFAAFRGNLRLRDSNFIVDFLPTDIKNINKEDFKDFYKHTESNGDTFINTDNVIKKDTYKSLLLSPRNTSTIYETDLVLNTCKVMNINLEDYNNFMLIKKTKKLINNIQGF